ncbi:MAG: hypothetical protein COA91_08455 [Robiginitomaculum sp.]|nr:MAG: hypothetical protein COA91_08455 [Robiginitomaculum sp.]
MSDQLDLSTLAARPPWRVPHMLVRAARVLFALSILAIVVGYFWASWVYKMSSQTEGLTELMVAYGGNPGELLLTVGMYTLTLAFYAGILWLISLIVDKVDQIVWLNATEQDRLNIYNQRQKKKNKNDKN